MRVTREFSPTKCLLVCIVSGIVLFFASCLAELFRSAFWVESGSDLTAGFNPTEVEINMKEYLPILVVFLFVLGFAVTNLILAHLLGRHRNTRAKLMPYECGVDPVGSAHQRFSVRFYMVAMMFILFDIEAVFLLPWAVVFRSLSEKLSRPFVYAEMMVFLIVLLIGYVYVWKKGVFEWNRG